MRRMTTAQHVRRLGLLIVAASALLWWLISPHGCLLRRRLTLHRPGQGHRPGLMDAGARPFRGPSDLSHGDRGRASPAGGQRSPRLANRRAGRRRDLRSFARHSGLPGQPRGLRAGERMAGLFLDLLAALQRSRSRGRTQREHVLAVLDLGPLVDPEVSAGGRPLAGCRS